LSQLQSEHAEWLEYNFPSQREYQPLLGMVEELGELAHAHLKHEQGIRGYTTTEYFRDAEDAIGDFVIYLASYCNTNAINLERAVEVTWARVKRRDWVADPVKGGES
jgi:NTP pyrophosphatase (non-canonical NTP hydrolase)